MFDVKVDHERGPHHSSNQFVHDLQLTVILHVHAMNEYRKLRVFDIQKTRMLGLFLRKMLAPTFMSTL